jgi:hypothetical protein
MKEHPEFLTKIDWKLLKEQKARLNNIIEVANIFQEDVDALTGIQHLIDTIQDYAVDKMGLSDKEVFNLTPEEE